MRIVVRSIDGVGPRANQRALGELPQRREPKRRAALA